MQITVTAAEIKTLATIGNLFTWNDGATTWTLDNLAEALTDEALEGMGTDSEITLTADGLTEEGRAKFVEGFTAAAPSGYDPEADGESMLPWCAPWYWCPTSDWFRPELGAYQMGEAWAEHCRAELEAHYRK